MSDLLVDLATFKTIKELKVFTTRLQQLVLDLRRQLELKDEKLRQMEEMLKISSLPTIQGNMPSNEELTCLEQIARLKDSSSQRALDDKEIKSLEILVRTLRSIQGKKEEPEDVIDVTSISKSSLLSLAEKKDDE